MTEDDSKYIEDIVAIVGKGEWVNDRVEMHGQCHQCHDRLGQYRSGKASLERIEADGHGLDDVREDDRPGKEHEVCRHVEQLGQMHADNVVLFVTFTWLAKHPCNAGKKYTKYDTAVPNHEQSKGREQGNVWP